MTYSALLFGFTLLQAQVNQSQALVFAGLRSSSAHGVFRSVRSDASGNLYLLFDQGDGVRVLKTDSTASALLAETRIGNADDVGLALELDPSGDIYVAGTTTSSALPATAGAAFGRSRGKFDGRLLHSDAQRCLHPHCQVSLSRSLNLTLTPDEGFTGTVVLACVAVVAGPYTSCSLQPSSVSLTGAPHGATATISTLSVVTVARNPGYSRAIFLCLLLPASLLLRRCPRARRSLSANLLLLALCTALASVCGGGGNPNIRYSPPGTYQYQVTASSTSGPAITQSVTLNIVVQ